MKRTISFLVGVIIVGLLPCSTVFALEQNSWTAESRTVVIEVEKGELPAADGNDLPDELEDQELEEAEEEADLPPVNIEDSAEDIATDDDDPVAEDDLDDDLIDDLIEVVTTDEAETDTVGRGTEEQVAISEPVEISTGADRTETVEEQTPVEEPDDETTEEPEAETAGELSEADKMSEDTVDDAAIVDTAEADTMSTAEDETETTDDNETLDETETGNDIDNKGEEI